MEAGVLLRSVVFAEAGVSVATAKLTTCFVQPSVLCQLLELGPHPSLCAQRRLFSDDRPPQRAVGGRALLPQVGQETESTQQTVLYFHQRSGIFLFYVLIEET